MCSLAAGRDHQRKACWWVRRLAFLAQQADKPHPLLRFEIRSFKPFFSIIANAHWFSMSTARGSLLGVMVALVISIVQENFGGNCRFYKRFRGMAASEKQQPICLCSLSARCDHKHARASWLRRRQSRANSALRQCPTFQTSKTYHYPFSCRLATAHCVGYDEGWHEAPPQS